MENILQDIEKVLFTHEEIVEASKRIAKQIEEDYKDKEPVLICTLKGALPFMAELMKHIDIHVVTDFIDVSSYHGGTESTGTIIIKKDVGMDIAGRDVIIVEDIVDTGATMKRMLETLGTREPAGLHITTLLLKPGKLTVPLNIEYAAMEIPNDFIVGYGLDYDQEGRNLRDIYTLVQE